MEIDMNALMDAQIRVDVSRMDEVARWAFLLEGTETGDALSQKTPMTIRLCAAQTYAWLAIQNSEQMTLDVIDELNAAAAEARGSVK